MPRLVARYWASRWVPFAFTVTPPMMSILGANADDMEEILKGLGYRAEPKPAADVKARLEALEARDDACPGLLDHLGGHVVAPGVGASQAQHGRVVALHEAGEGRLVAAPQRPHQARLVRAVRALTRRH